MVGSGLQMAATRPCTAYSKRMLVSTTVSGVKFGSLSSISSVQFLKPGFAPTAFKLNNFVTRAIASKSENSAPTGLSIDLRGKRAFIAGVADDNGYGWAIAKALAAAGAEILAGTWVPALNIFEASLRRGKFDGSRKLPDASLMESTKVYPLDAVYDTPDDVPEDIKNNKRYTGSSKWTEKVSKSTILVLLSALIILVFQPILVQPAYATAVHSANKTFIKSELLSSAWTGFFAGCLHTLSGPDHLAALAPLSIGRTRVESAAVGALWGCGHDAGQLIFGLVFLLLKDRLHIETIQTWGTRVVGLTLLVIGAMGIKEASEIPMHYVSLENGDVNTSEPKKKIGFATFATGIVHGLQPDALMMILPALALPSRKAGAAFLGMFLLGTVIAMGSYTVFIGSCSQALKDRIPRITEKLTWAASLIAISMGVAIIVSQFFGFSLY